MRDCAKLNVDAAFGAGQAGISCVARDDKGQVHSVAVQGIELAFVHAKCQRMA